MSKEEFMKIQTYVLKVNIHCDGCKSKVKKILQKIDGVFFTHIDSELGKVTVSGNVDPSVLIKKLAKSGKHAEVWGAQKVNNQNNLTNQFKNMQLDNGKGGNNNNKGQKGGNNSNNQQLKGGGQPNPQQLQQLQQMKGFQDVKLPPQFKDIKMPNMKDPNPNQKAVKFNLPEYDDLTDIDDDDDDECDDDDFGDDYLDDELDDPYPQLNKTKPIIPNAAQGLPQSMTTMMNGNHPQLINGQNGAQKGGQNVKNGGGGGPVPVQVNMANEGKNGNGGKKGGGGGNSQNQGGKAGKSGGGMPNDGKNGNNSGRGKNGNNAGGDTIANLNMNGNGGKKGNTGSGGGGGGGMGDMANVVPNMGVHGYPGMAAAAAAAAGNAKLGQMGMGNMSMGQMGNVPMGQMGNIPAVQGLPAAVMNRGGGGGGGAGYFQGAGPDLMPGNPYHQQQQQYMAAAMMNQQRAMGNEMFQPMIYARPPAAVNYMPQHPYPYPYHHPNVAPPQDPSYAHIFSDENTSSCNVM